MAGYGKKGHGFTEEDLWDNRWNIFWGGLPLFGLAAVLLLFFSGNFVQMGAWAIFLTLIAIKWLCIALIFGAAVLTLSAMIAAAYFIVLAFCPLKS